jgi:GAF domain-containing protein
LSPSAARDLLVASGRALAHTDGRNASLQVLVDAIGQATGTGSVAILLRDTDGGLGVAASVGVAGPTRAALEAAVRNPAHPIARTIADPVSTYDVPPTAPGGPALRSHLPLKVTRSGTDIVLGVLALAHDQPIDPAMHPVLEAVADLAAAVVDRDLGATRGSS